MGRPTDRAADEMDNRVKHLLAAADATPATDEAQAQAVRGIASAMRDLRIRLNGDRTLARRYEPTPLGLVSRINTIAFAHWDSRAEVPTTLTDSFAVADAEFREVLTELKSIETELSSLEEVLEAKGAPWTPGRIPDWP